VCHACKQVEHANITAALGAREQHLSSELASANARIGSFESQLVAAAAQHEVSCAASPLAGPVTLGPDSSGIVSYDADRTGL